MLARRTFAPFSTAVAIGDTLELTDLADATVTGRLGTWKVWWLRDRIQERSRWTAEHWPST